MGGQAVNLAGARAGGWPCTTVCGQQCWTAVIKLYFGDSLTVGEQHKILVYGIQPPGQAYRAEPVDDLLAVSDAQYCMIQITTCINDAEQAYIGEFMLRICRQCACRFCRQY